MQGGRDRGWPSGPACRSGHASPTLAEPLSGGGSAVRVRVSRRSSGLLGKCEVDAKGNLKWGPRVSSSPPVAGISQEVIDC